MRLDKKKVTVTLVLTVGLTYTSVMPSITYAKTSLDKVKDQESSTQSLKAKLSVQQEKVQNDLKAINKRQLSLTGKISQGQSDINQANDQIDALKSDIGVIQKRIDARKTILDQRLVSIYKNGGTADYLEVLMGSKSFGDFVNRVKALHMITSQDQKILTDQQNDKEAVSKKKKTIETKQASNVAKLEELKNTLSQVEQLQVQKKIAAGALSTKQSSLSKKLTALSNAEASLNAKQVSADVTPASYSASSNDNSSTTGAASDNNSNSSSNSTQGSSSGSNSNNGSSTSSAPASQPAPSAKPAGLSASVASGGISGILNYGNRFIGNSTYVFGASNPAGHQFDCSGFVHAAFAANGIGVGRTTDALVSEGSPVSISQAKPGDLVFFDTYKTNGHVAIYLGGGRFIGSQSGTGVAIVSMSNPYWKSHFRGVVRRILN
ncbi:MAG: NlpC/P60 family protein [Sporolactobacillus sp.]